MSTSMRARPLRGRRHACLLGAVVVLASIGCPRPQPELRSQPRRDTEMPGDGAPASAAFVVVLDDRTLVLPTERDAPVVSAPGVWVLDDMVEPASVRFHPTERGLPPCPSDGDPRACTGPVIVEPGNAPLCGCTGSIHESIDGVDESGEVCSSVSLRPVSIVGGVLYLHGDLHDTCGGMNIYDVSSVRVPMVAQPAADPTGGALLGCAEGHVGPPLVAPWPTGASACESDDEGVADCSACPKMVGEASVVVLHRGELLRVEDEMDTSGATRRQWFGGPISATSCPSRGDPCGAPTGALAEADDAWVATDGSAALRRDGDRLTVVDGVSVTASDAVVGVRYHADVRPLVAAMRARAPVPIAP